MIFSTQRFSKFAVTLATVALALGTTTERAQQKLHIAGNYENMTPEQATKAAAYPKK